MRTHSQHAVKSHAVANTEFPHDINGQTAAVFPQRSASFAHSPIVPVALNAQPDPQSPSHCQSGLKVVDDAVNGNLDYCVYKPE